MLRTKIYNIESKIKDAILNNDKSEKDKQNHEWSSTLNDVFGFPISNVFNHSVTTHIDSNILKLVFLSRSEDGFENIDKDISKCYEFIERELNVNIQNVTLTRVNGDFDCAEAFAVPCQNANHIVVFPAKGSGNFESNDLLIHELAHAAEFTIRRQEKSDSFLLTHKILSEAIAHYCQYKYLLKYGNKDKRIGSIGSITKEYLTLKSILAFMEENPSESIFSTKKIFENAHLNDFINIYGKKRLSEILQTYCGLKIIEIYHYYIEPRLGAFIALRLINNPQAIRALCLAPIEQDVTTILNNLNLDPNLIMNFSNTSDLLSDYIEGKLTTN